MKIKIELDAYQIINLLQALKVVPNNGQWKVDVIVKIVDAIQAIGWTREKLEEEYSPNSGMDIQDIKRQAEILEWKKRHGKS